MEAAVVLVVLAGLVLALALTRYPADALLFGALVVLMVFPVLGAEGWRLGVLGPKEALAGFSNSGMITVAILFMVCAGVLRTGGAEAVAQWVMGSPKSLRMAVMRMCGAVLASSAFLNNTPIVAIFIPVIAGWARRFRFSPSKLMLPLSYAAILGGTCSLIGTSTNLVVSGLVISQTDIEPLRLFDIAWIGIPTALAGFICLSTVGLKLLPERTSFTDIVANSREYTVEMKLLPSSPLVGKTIQEAGLRHLQGAYLIEIERGGAILNAVGPEERLQGDDRLIFAGVVESVKDLRLLPGMLPATDQVFKLSEPRYKGRLFEAVVSETCPIVGKSIREGRFRTVYGAAVIATTRNGQRIPGKLGDIVLRAGDALLLEASPGFLERFKNSRDFLLASELADSAPRKAENGWVALAILTAMVGAAALGWLSMLQAAAIAACLMIITRCCTATDARQSIDWSVLVVIACALAIGKALETSGAAALVAHGAFRLAGDHPWLTLAVVYLLTSALTEVITNNAAVALVFPIAKAAAEGMEVSFLPYVMAIMMAGSASFATPIGYQTNLMVFGPGGYRFSDYLRIGIPLNILAFAVAAALIPLIWPF